MRKRARAVVSILTPLPMTEVTDCHALLRALCAQKSLVPEYFDVVEPIREHFDCDRIEAVVETVWKWQKGPFSFMWRRRRQPASWGELYVNSWGRPQHASVYLECKVGVDGDVVQFLRNAAMTVKADLGFVDASPPDCEGWRQSHLTTWSVAKGLPGVYWGTVLGKPYAELIGAERLSAAPVDRCERLGPDLFYLQLTAKLEDTYLQPDVVDTRRAALLDYLGKDLFATDGGSAGPPRAPSFSFQ